MAVSIANVPATSFGAVSAVGGGLTLTGSTVSLGDAGLTWDAVNKRIGINNAAPECVFQSGATVGALALLGAPSMPGVISLQGPAGSFPGILFGIDATARGALYCDAGGGLALTTNVGTLQISGVSSTTVSASAVILNGSTSVQVKIGATSLLWGTAAAGVCGTNAASGNLNLGSTTNATKGLVRIGNNAATAILTVVDGGTNGQALVGINNESPGGQLDVKSTGNCTELLTGGGSGSQVAIVIANPTNGMDIRVRSTAATLLGVASAGAQVNYNGAIGPLAVGTNGAFDLAFSTNSVERARVDSLGNLSIGTAAIATTATDGFLYLSTCAGTPTGVPTAKTGRAPVVYDSTANKIWVYNGSWRGVAVT